MFNYILDIFKIIILIIHFVYITDLCTAGNLIDPDSIKTDESEISWGADMDFNNKYVWRGITYDDGFVVQPDIWISYRNFTFGIWSNIALHGMHPSVRPDEVDLSLSYEYALLNMEIENSFLYYHYPQQPDSPPTGEFYFGIGYPVGDLKLDANFTIDIAKYAGAFFIETGIEFDKSLTKEFSLTSLLKMDWASGKFNETYVGISKTTMNTISANIAFTCYPIACLYLKPHVQVNKTIDKDLFEALNRHSTVFGLLIGLEL